MPNPPPTEKIKSIYQLLFNLAMGRSSANLQHCSSDDAFDEILLSFSRNGARLRELVIAQGTVLPHQGFQPLYPFVVVLDASSKITSFSCAVASRLKYAPETIQHLCFEDLLDASSKSAWVTIREQARSEHALLVNAEFLLLTSDGYKVPLYCSVSCSPTHDSLFVVGVEMELLFAASLQDVPSGTSPIEQQAAAAQKVHDYILEHLDAPLPSARSLALLFGTEEHSLRKTFRLHYNTSLYQCYQEERLRKACLLISHTDLPLKEVAYHCGFEYYLNFYKTFRKKYGFPPSQLSRNPK